MVNYRSMSSPSRSPATTNDARPYIGGQAVLEGVMMRAPRSFAIALRRRDKTLHVRERPIRDERTGLRRLPLVRGIASLVESLKLGSEALRFSAEQMEKDLAIEEAAAKKDAEKKKADASRAAMSALSALGLMLFQLVTKADGEPVPTGDGQGDGDAKKSKGPMGFMLIVAVVFLIALPQMATAGVNRALHLGMEVQSPLFQVVTGAFKLTIVVGYLLLIRRVSDIRRVFQYHGAEHKTISTYEANEELVVANARAKTTLHPRCGTTFLVMVALVSILVFTAIGSFLPRIQTGSGVLDNLVFFVEKLPFLPVIAGVTFEIQRVFARYCTTGPLRALLWPGFLVQKITTIEPDDEQLEVALASLRATLFREVDPARAERAGTGDVRFATYDDIAKAERLRAVA
jgi:uncharacterized protein YqhQ